MKSLWMLTVQYKSLLWIGVKATFLVSILAIILGFFLGVIVCFMRLSKIKIINKIAFIYVELIRGTPDLLQIAMVYYGLPLLGINFPTVTIGGLQINRFACAVIALMINCAAYISEIIRGGILSIDPGQEEAALSLGYTKAQAMMSIIFPAALKNCIPALGNNFITLLKSSSQVSTIGLADLMYTANIIRGNSFLPFMPLVLVAIFYLIMTLGISAILRKAERKMNTSGSNAKA